MITILLMLTTYDKILLMLTSHDKTSCDNNCTCAYYFAIKVLLMPTTHDENSIYVSYS